MMQDDKAFFDRVLRVSREPFAYFDEEQVNRILTEDPSAYRRFVHGELAAVASGAIRMELPPKQLFQDPGSLSDFRVMPCVLRGHGTVRKTVKIVGTNARQQTVPDQITVGKAVALDPEENFVSHVFEICLLSSARTGICAAIAMDLLATSRRRVSIVGAGRVGYYTGLYAATLEGVEEIRFTDIRQERAAAAAALLARYAPGVRSTSGEFASLGETDVLVLATTSTEPLCSPPGFGANLVISLGADTDLQRELNPAWAAAADIFVDTADTVRFGDLHAWQEQGLIRQEKITDLVTLLRAGTAGNPQRPRVFVSTGSALFDNITIGYIIGRQGS